MDYTAAFTTSATGALDSNNGTITLSTSGSTGFPSNCSYTVTDVTTGQSTETCPTSASGSTVTISAGVTFGGVTANCDNLGRPSASTGGRGAPTI